MRIQILGLINILLSGYQYLVYSSLFLFLLIPIFSLVFTFLLSFRNINIRVLIFFNLISMFLLFINAFVIFCGFVFFSFKPFVFGDLGEWITLGELKLSWNFSFDYVTIIMLFVVTTVSFLVHLYSLDYMAGDPNHLKFMQYLTLFTLAMYILITANNFVQLFIGWEGVGICSFLLINFWDTRIMANTSAMKAIIVNRIGDFGLMFAFILIYNVFGNFDYSVIFGIVNLVNSVFWYDLIECIVFFLFIGAVGKSAQVFLHVWLPDAMEGCKGSSNNKLYNMRGYLLNLSPLKTN